MEFDPDLGVEEVDRTPEVEANAEMVEELRREAAERERSLIDDVRQEITERRAMPPLPFGDADRIANYQTRAIPAPLRTPREREPFAARLYGMFASAEGMAEAREALPADGPFLVVANHAGGESPVLMKLLKEYDTHLAAGAELNFERSGLRKWLLGKMRMIPVRESLSNLDDEEKSELLDRVPGTKRQVAYAKIMAREHDGGVAANTEFVKQAVALLSRGDVVVMFPEGLFLYDDNKGLRKAYAGVELVAREFKRLTGRDLPVVPVAVWKNAEGKHIEVGDALKLDKHKGTDTTAVMRRLAELLPDELRGAYGE